jgi:hypothetical protein
VDGVIWVGAMGGRLGCETWWVWWHIWVGWIDCGGMCVWHVGGGRGWGGWCVRVWHGCGMGGSGGIFGLGVVCGWVGWRVCVVVCGRVVVGSGRLWDDGCRQGVR